LKKIKIAFMLSIVLLFTLSFGNFVGAVSQSNEKAIILNKLSILAGDGNGYNLTGELTRGQAITFIVRMMGQESYVTANKAKYAVTPFSDVKKTDWFAPVVGYSAEQKIVNGFTDGKFYPNDNVSEKAFLKLLLGALGYKADVDFTWDEIYAFSAKIGLVNGNYTTKTLDNLQYTREEVVNVLYTSLSLVNKQTNQKLIDLLDPKHTIIPELAPAPTPTPDALPTQVSKITVQNGKNITIQLNENIQSIDAANILVYEAGNKTNKLNASINSQASNTLILKTDQQKPNQNYILELANVKDTDGNVASLVSANFTGYVNPEVKSDFFKISKVETISKNIINVYFTQPVNSNVELPLFYEITKNGASYIKGSFSNLTVKVLSSKANAITILLKNDLISSDALYAINISSEVNSIYNVRLNDGQGDSMNFAANSTENKPFELVDLQPLDDKTIQVTFSDEVDPVTGVQLSNYTIANTNGTPGFISNVVISGEGDSNGKVVKLQVASSLLVNNNYVLTIKNVADKTKQNIIAETKYPLTGQGLSVRQDLKLLNVTAEDKTTLSLYFDRKLDPTSAANIGNYMLTGAGFSGSISKVYFNPAEPYKVKLFLPVSPGISAGVTYTLTVFSSMLDELGRSSMANATLTFPGSGTTTIDPLIYDARIIGKDIVRFNTNVEILNSGTNLDVTNYMLEYKDGNNTVTKQASSVNIINGTTGIVSFDNLDMTKTYSLKFNTLTDYSNLFTRIVADGLTSHTVEVGK
jgi:hypothetical protein